MTKREFFIVIVRLFALYMICTEVMSVFVSVPYAGFDADSIRLILATLVLCILLVLLIMNAAKIVDGLKMTSGLNEEFSGPSLSGRNLVQIGIIILGLNLSLSVILDLLLGVLDLFRSEVSSDVDSAFEPLTFASTTHLPVVFVKVAFGFLLVWKSGWLTGLIMKKVES
jgi:hypothetical protein